MDDSFISELVDLLIAGKIDDSLTIYEKYSAKFSSHEFLENIFYPAITKIEKNFEDKKISNAAYHVAKNTSAIFAKIISES